MMDERAMADQYQVLEELGSQSDFKRNIEVPRSFACI